MKKILVAILTIFTLSSPSWAKNITVNGIVVDEKKAPLAGCLITVDNNRNSINYAQTNGDGSFNLTIDPATNKEITIDCSSLDYKTQHIPIQPERRDYGTIIMEPNTKSILLDQTLVTASSCTDLALKYANAKTGTTKIQNENDENSEIYCDPNCDETTQIKIKKTVQYQESDLPQDDIDEKVRKKFLAPRKILYCSNECLAKDSDNLKKNGATATKILNGRCIPAACKEPRYKLENEGTENAQCVDFVNKACYESEDLYALAAKYEYDAKQDKLNCVPVDCMAGYTLSKKTKKCEISKCPCGQDESNNECVDWEDMGATQCAKLPAHAKSAERACDGDQEYCKILTCNGDGYKDENLHEFELDTKQNKCVSRVNGKCTPTGIEHATDGKYQKSDEQYKLFCAVTKCEANYVPSDDGTACEPSGCTKKQEDDLKAAHATSWKLADNKKDCIPTKCECGYGTVDGQPVGGTCNTAKWSWDDNKPNENKQNCTIKNAKEAYMDCDASGEAYCRVYECDTTSGFNLYGNECIQGACNPKDFKNALYVKRVGDKCIIQECETGYDVNKEGTKCVARDDLLSEEDSQARIKELQENEDAVAKNAQRIENRVLDTLGIGGAGMGGQMLASGIAQKKADKDAERDMTAYLATFRCKYGNESVDSGGDEVQLPGANDETYASLLSEYKTLAASLKMRKNALGMAPGIESDEILDGSTLYGRGNTGGADGAYLSLADALSGDTDAKNEWDDQKEKARDMAIGGSVLAGGAIIGSAVGSYFENKDAPKNKADEINKKYDVNRGTITPQEKTEDSASQ